MPHLNSSESKQLPDAAGPVGGKRKTRKSIKKKRVKKTRHKRGGARPTPPPSPVSDQEESTGRVIDEIMDHLQPMWTGIHLYSSYINEAFRTIADIDTIELLYRDGDLGYFFDQLIIPRFRVAIEENPSNWNVILENLRSRQPGRIVSELELRNRRLARTVSYTHLTLPTTPYV